MFFCGGLSFLVKACEFAAVCHMSLLMSHPHGPRQEEVPCVIGGKEIFTGNVETSRETRSTATTLLKQIFVV